MADTILDTVRLNIRNLLNEVTDDIAGGSCLSADNVAVEYAQRAGIIQGLARAELIINDVLDQIEEREKLDT